MDDLRPIPFEDDDARLPHDYLCDLLQLGCVRRHSIYWVETMDPVSHSLDGSVFRHNYLRTSLAEVYRLFDEKRLNL
jgi:hypothetical protein